ncbi:NADP-dependent oxidoreductase [Rhodoblastus sp.]|uniref:NADP-dependent oxidoreductase n=1 Tax=Rhodoblastus sp. TaxID=1962975 RepID=UPI003F968C1F
MGIANRQWILASRPKGLVGPEVLTLQQNAIGPLSGGEALARVRYISIDPTMRTWMSDRPSYIPPVPLGEVMRAAGLAEVIDSRHPQLRKGDRVVALTGLQDYVVFSGEMDPRYFQKLPAIRGISETTLLGVFGITGMAAYFGMTEIGKPKKNETLVVSSAAGAVGSVAGQIGKIYGCRVVGIVGNEEKRRWVTEDLGFDAAVNYKNPNWKAQLAAATPQGVDINFENVGGPVMRAVLERMNVRGRVVLCGLISTYAEESREALDLWDVLVKNLTVGGFITMNYSARYKEALRRLAWWRWRGRLKDRVTVVEGLEKAPEAINMLFAGANQGKLLLKI